MSGTKHWPGPWTLVPRRDRYVNVYCGPHDVALAVRPCNAQLIAAAPDMLAALERLLGCPDLNLDELEPETCEAIEQARAAIVKARGQ